MGRIISSLFLLVFLLTPARGEYMRVWYIQYVKDNHTANYGDCVYYEFPGEDGILDTADDKNLLFDAGCTPDESDSSWALYKFLDNKIGRGGKLWFMMLSHAHFDHYSGLKNVIDRYKVKYYYEGSDASAYNKVYRYYYNIFKPAVIGEVGQSGIYYVEPGDWLSGSQTNKGPGWDPRIKARVLASVDEDTGNLNDNSVVLKISCGKSTFLQGGDATGDREDLSPEYYALNHYPDEFPINVWKIHHHGSNSHLSNSRQFLDICRPEYAINLTGYGTRRLPNARTLKRIRNYGARIYRVDLDGTICIRCDNQGNFDIGRSRVYIDETETPGGAGAWRVPPPELPKGLRVIGRTKTSVSLAWDSSREEYRYDIFRSRCPGGDPGAGKSIKPGMDEPTGIYKRIKSGVNGTAWTDKTCVEGKWYFYRISVWDKVHGYERRYSNEVSTRTLGRDATPPAATENLSALTGTLAGTINLAWSAPGNDGNIGPITDGKWRIAYSTDSNYQFSISNYQLEIPTSNILPTSVIWYLASDLTPGATYYFCIWTADEANNWSGISNLAVAQAKHGLPPAISKITCRVRIIILILGLVLVGIIVLWLVRKEFA